jgi:hypothetical protein
MRLKVSFAPVQDYTQILLMLYQDDDNYVEEEFSYNDFLGGPPFDLTGPLAITMDREFFSFPSRAFWANYTGTNVTMRLDRDPATANISALFSPDGTNWTTLGQISQALTNTQLAIITGGAQSTFPLSNLPNCDLGQVDIITSDTYSPPGVQLLLQPQHLVFNSVQDQASVTTQRVNVVLRPSGNPVNWTVSSGAGWLSANVASGQTPGFCDVSVNTAGLTPGIYQGTLSFSASGPTNSPAAVTVTLIINPDGLVRVSPWMNTRSGAMTVWVDDSAPTAFDDLSTNGLAGTYLIWHEGAPAFFTTYYQAGMEIGSHTVDHPCFVVNEPTLRFELETNIVTLLASIPVPRNQVISFGWPAGVTSPEEETVAADYFLVSRGYNTNTLEDPTPRDFMNLKSYNSHEHFPYPPADLKTVVDAAIAQGKWFNLVLHTTNNDNGAIAYSVGKDIWFAPGGTVTKYILQRDRTVITNYVQAPNYIQFDCYRLPLDSSSLRSFETAFGSNDVLTLTVNVSSSQVFGLLINGVPTAFTNNGNMLYFNTQVTTNTQTVLLNLASNTPPVLTPQSDRVLNELTTLTVTNTATDSDVPAQTLSYMLVVSNNLNGAIAGNATIDANGIISWTPTEGQSPGTYRLTTIVTDSGYPPKSVTNAFTVTVNEVNVAPILPAQANRILVGQQTLVAINTATDSDIPPNPMSYQLMTAPGGAVIDGNGIITWTPSLAQIPSTNVFTTVVTDTSVFAVNALHLSATNSFTVLVQTNVIALPNQANRTNNGATTLVVTNTLTILTNVLGGGPLVTNSLWFNYTNRTALLADGWSFLATSPGGESRDTEVTNTNIGVVSYAQTNNSLGTVLRIPCDIGDLWQSINSTENSLFHSLPTNWINMRLVTSFAPGQNFQQAQLALYQDDDNYVEVGRTFNTYSSGQSMEFTIETAHQPASLGSVNVTATNVALRLDRDTGNGTITALYSVDALTWVSLGQTTQGLTNTRLGIWVGASTIAFSNTLLNCDLSRVDIVITNPTVPITYTLTVTNLADNSMVTNAPINSNGLITWTPTPAQVPGLYAFTTIANFGGYQAINSFTVTVNSVNTPPVAQDDAYAMDAGSVLTVPAPGVLGNDTDADLDILSATLSTGPANGVLSLQSNGSFSYTPANGFAGTDTFTYQANDGLTNSAAATVSITVSPLQILSISLSNSIATITWTSISNHLYRLQSASSLPTTNWIDVQPDYVAAQSTITVTNSPADPTQQFYRVLLVQ